MRKLTDSDKTGIIGATLSGYHIERARVKRGSCTDSDHYGIVMGQDARGMCVTWQFHLDENEKPVVYWGHYYPEHNSAVRDYDTRDMGGEPTGRYEVTITETLKRTVTVEAESRDEAEQIISDQWRAEQHVLTADDFTGAVFEAVEAGEERGAT